MKYTDIDVAMVFYCSEKNSVSQQKKKYFLEVHLFSIMLQRERWITKQMKLLKLSIIMLHTQKHSDIT